MPVQVFFVDFSWLFPLNVFRFFKIWICHYQIKLKIIQMATYHAGNTSEAIA